MSTDQIVELEKRASAAEHAIATMKQQLKAQSATGNGDAALESRLRQLLVVMREDQQECEAIRAQRDDLKEENERLRAQVARHEYRIKHLLRTINELDSEQKQQ
ncbi:hypothetical protein DQ04_03561030 [Trypanosoma grayi]|uniref:hypothetical protein n=1 Tax=Trypanosoma grayi TaxID=71804 RepID=UPI0004F48D47|nr:hypothetical protein DQ04_03561030 [Trypanosoma grayi]KEG10565.1 hypothetical protein DQ04_03561030 [Trypanosoma grayi]